MFRVSICMCWQTKNKNMSRIGVRYCSKCFKSRLKNIQATRKKPGLNLKEFVDSELACGLVSKLLLEVAIDLGLKLIAKTLILLQWICFTLRIVRSNSPQVFTLRQFVSLIFLGDHISVFFIFPLLCMILSLFI